MSQPQFNDGPPVPMMVEGVVDAATLRTLFTDLSTAARIISVREKQAPTAFTLTAPLTPGDALARLLAGDARSVQIRYHFADNEWTDTVLALPGGFRVVRCRHDATP